jgi:hypothetical protein
MAKYVKVCKKVLKGITNDSYCKSSGQDLRKDMCLGIRKESTSTSRRLIIKYMERISE